MTRLRSKRVIASFLGLVLAGSGGVVLGQVESAAPVAPVDDSGSFEVDGIAVDVTGKTSQDAREAGWRLAERKAWALLAKRFGQSGNSIADSTLDNIVSGVIVENEQIGPDRYIARLGVTFSRDRAGPMLGVAGGGFRSPPMLVLPLEWSGGTAVAYEQDTPWREAWARFRTGNSAIDYVRPAGTGPDALLLNLGQAERPGRGWWKAVLDQYGASDVLMPTVHLYDAYPGGPVIGVFEARYGPDNMLLKRYTLRVNNGDGIDAAYQDALKGGILRTDPGLAYAAPAPTPTATPTIDLDALAAQQAAATAAQQQGTSIDVQFDTPDAAAVNVGEAAVRAVPGVVSAATTSLAIGGVSVMHVTFNGNQAALAAGLQAHGWQVQSGEGVLRMRRSAPAAAPEGKTSG